MTDGTYKMIDLVFKDPTCKKIAVRLSGGPDSALIYYAVCNYYKHDQDVKIYPYTMSSPLRPHSIKKAKDVVYFVTSLTGKAPEKHYHLHYLNHNADNDSKTNQDEYTLGQDILEQSLHSEVKIDIRYTGLSMNCPENEIVKYVDSLPWNRAIKYNGTVDTRAHDRDTLFESRIYMIGTYYSFSPLTNVDKREVKKLYDHFNLTKTLYPLTWSCESPIQNQQENPKHCGTCYFCLEREFAFGKL